MQIDIFSDVVCPWCFVGKKRLELALQQRPDISTEMVWHPFQLNPDMPLEGVNSEAFFAAKFGNPAQVRSRRAMVIEAGASVGIKFAFELIEREPNTRDAHRLIRFAGANGAANELVEALFQAHFVLGRYIGDRSVLAAIAGETGLDAGEASEFLVSEAAVAEVTAEERNARKLGINAVPCYIFERQYAISGAQEAEFFFPVFDLVANGGGIDNPSTA